MSDIAISPVLPTCRLIGFNLAWHAQVMRDIIYRYKILVIFICLIAATSFHGLLQIISFPASYLLADHPQIGPYFASLLFYQGLAIAWVQLNDRSLNQPQWKGYLHSLPVKKWNLLICDSVVLLFIDVPILLPFVVAMSLHLPHTSTFIRALSVIIAMLCMQIAFTKRKFGIMTLLLLLNMAGAINFFEVSFSKKLIKSATIKHSFLCKLKISAIAANLDGRKQLTRLAAKLSLPFLVIYLLKDLAWLYPWARLGAIFAGFYGLFIISNSYAEIEREKAHYQNYLSSLPINYANQRLTEWLLIAGIATLYYLCLIVFSCAFLKGSMANYFIQYGTAILYISFVFYPQKYFTKYGSLIALILLIPMIYLYSTLHALFIGPL